MNVHAVIHEVERVARRQNGVIHRNQMVALGVTPGMVRHRVQTKSWIRLSPTVYALSSAAPTWQRQYKAAELTTPGSSIFGLAAGHVLRWEGFGTVVRRSSHRTPRITAIRLPSYIGL